MSILWWEPYRTIKSKKCLIWWDINKKYNVTKKSLKIKTMIWKQLYTKWMKYIWYHKCIRNKYKSTRRTFNRSSNSIKIHKNCTKVVRDNIHHRYNNCINRITLCKNNWMYWHVRYGNTILVSTRWRVAPRLLQCRFLFRVVSYYRFVLTIRTTKSI